MHGELPDSMLSVVLVPVVKDKTGKISSLENYRQIALASVLAKVLEQIILDRLQLDIGSPLTTSLVLKMNIAQIFVFMH